MPELKPFKGIRYLAAHELADLVCPPYDVISPEQQNELYARHPHNAVRLELAQTGGDPSGYAQVGELFRSWLDDGTLVADPGDSLYVYRQDFVAGGVDRRSVAGVIGALTLEELGSGVLPHERTMPGPKKDRLALMRACPVNISPIYAVYRGGGVLRGPLDEISRRDPHGRLTDESGVMHRLWVVDDPDVIAELTRPVASAPLVIADGHHRYETALAYHAEQGDAPGGHGAIMCYCVDVDSEDLMVLSYNRAITASVPAAGLARRLMERLGAREAGYDEALGALASSEAEHPFAFVLDGRCLLVTVDDAFVAARADGPRAWRDLDVVALHEAVLPEVLPEGADDIVFTKDPVEVRALVEDGRATFGVLLKAVDAADVVDVARSGARMPQKASYFWPKAITGFVLRSLR